MAASVEVAWHSRSDRLHVAQLIQSCRHADDALGAQPVLPPVPHLAVGGERDRGGVGAGNLHNRVLGGEGQRGGTLVVSLVVSCEALTTPREHEELRLPRRVRRDGAPALGHLCERPKALERQVAEHLAEHIILEKLGVFVLERHELENARDLPARVAGRVPGTLLHLPAHELPVIRGHRRDCRSLHFLAALERRGNSALQHSRGRIGEHEALILGRTLKRRTDARRTLALEDHIALELQESLSRQRRESGRMRIVHAPYRRGEAGLP